MGLVETARGLLPPGVAVAGGPIESWQGALPVAEEQAIAGAVPKRRAEFVAGRQAARAALGALGLAAAELPRSPAGPPLWPLGVTGSISHGGGAVLVAVGRRGASLAALGLDIEPCADLRHLAEAIGRPDEDRDRPLRLFGAKEAAGKAQFALTGLRLALAELKVEFWPDGRGFTATVLVPAGPWPAGRRIDGRQAEAEGLLVSAVALG
jgi:4'-phosphopantetheinyl transferase EntD